MTEEELIRGCPRFEHTSQRALYEIYFSKMMQLCIRYSKNQQEAKAILLDGFKNIFNDFKHYSDLDAKRKKDNAPISLEGWIKKQMIESAIQHMHDNKKEYFVSSTVSVRDLDKQSSDEITDEQIIRLADRELILKALQQLTPSHRAVYNLHEVDDYSHAEISRLLDISEYTSKDALSKAKFNLRKSLSRMLPK